MAPFGGGPCWQKGGNIHRWEPFPVFCFFFLGGGRCSWNFPSFLSFFANLVWHGIFFFGYFHCIVWLAIIMTPWMWMMEWLEWNSHVQHHKCGDFLMAGTYPKTHWAAFLLLSSFVCFHWIQLLACAEFLNFGVILWIIICCIFQACVEIDIDSKYTLED